MNVETALTPEERRLLLRLARAAIESELRGAPAPDPAALAAEAGASLGPGLLHRRGAFVTLHLRGRLRGCIGEIAGSRPLVEAVAANALAAAFDDPRFLPLSPDELPGLSLEISALTPLRPVAHWREIEIPRHGVVLARGGARAVFLPQVAREQGWDRATLLSHLARKAGLPADAWREGADFAVFEAEVFGEEES